MQGWKLRVNLLSSPLLSGDVPRVNGQLAVSRAFGDKSLKSHLRSDPDIRCENVTGETELLILASDGIWKVSSLIPKHFCVIVLVVSDSYKN